ncbi:pre-peptidase C-terminal domain-containing protein [Pseudoalteromonas luteoviolacea]|nr:pre-peptidase C-terminal domain-containing protein [Pseudoalteromonas luteoviolacea]MBQ4877813.1 pre-peptidase C-terminal domain-containing protein [Pseudoalteromonas luteoviolacea]MBQ4906741.1 pre-peptidase C-terminal domain-containing protein [Pseudoalteromonas luteoviolacea]
MKTMRALHFGLASTLIMAGSCYAGSDYHRIVWDANPSSQATIGFTPAGGSNHVVKYGTSTDESSWTTKAVTASHTFAGSLSNQFVKLTGLPADSAIYYRVCDSTGCGQHLWFKTAPTSTTTGFVAIAGGDTRTGWTTRRSGNQMVAKIRPLFIMHGGDYTNANSASEMKEYLKDWQLTFSSDLIGGQNYKRVYPFVATHGNHEDDNYKTLCQVFGVDYNNDGQCTSADTYGAFNVSNLLRVYTLNSQYKNSGWSSYAIAMNNWLKQDLQSQGNSAKWRVAQYHKPMYPHYSGKSDNTILHTWWANNFYDHSMNLVVESDTHINKITEALKPSGSNFAKTTTGGTVYVGEGSWGAPARSANDPKSWTIDLASIQQFKVLSVTPNKLEVRTAQFSSSTNTLSREQRAADPLALPGNVNWWYASGLGDVLPLVQSTSGRSIIDTPDLPNPNVLENDVPATGLTGAKGSKTIYTMEVPANTNQLSFTSSGGTGDVDMYVKFGSEPTTSSYDCRPYKDGNNESCSITNIQAGTYYVMLNGYATYSGVSLVGSYGTVADPGNKQQWTGLSASKSNWTYKTFEVPAGQAKLTVKISGGTGDADLYIRSGSQPTTSTYDCRPYENGNTETCTITNPTAGTWHLGVRAYETYSGVTLSAEY